MPRRTASTPAPYAAEQMFDLVADIEAYPEFLPWCKALRIVSRQDADEATSVVSDMLVGYRMFRETFRSRARFDRARLRIDTEYVSGPLSDLANHWRFEPLDPAAMTAEGPAAKSVVHFDVSFTLRNPLLQRAASAVFEHAFARMAEAFIDRAAVVYGATAP